MERRKNDRFHRLAAHLAEALGKRFACEFSVKPGSNVTRFAIKSQRISSPFYELELSIFERLAVSITDGVHSQGFMAVIEISHCTRQSEQGWDFDHESVERAAVRLIDLGVEFYREIEEGRNLTNQLIGTSQETK